MEDEEFMTMESGKLYKDCPQTVLNHGRVEGSSRCLS
jgi:hypothetical protein